MWLNFCLFLNSLVFAADLKLSGWVSCSNWACNEAIQEGVARLNFIGLKVSQIFYESINYISLTMISTGLKFNQEIQSL